jgi:hypothetical protein
VNGENIIDSITSGKEFLWDFKENFTVEREFNFATPISGEWEINSDNNIIVTLKMPLNAEGVTYFEKDTLNLTRLTNQEMWIEHPGRIVEKYEAQ